jgi:uncharacterized protein (DUF58 family)
MVRREEQPWESRATLVLDTRAHAHRGDGPTASFEWAVSAIASIAVHLRQNGYKLRLVTGSGIDLDATEAGGEGAVLDCLAEVRTDPKHELSTLVETVRRRTDGGLVIGVFGSLSAAESELLGGLRVSGSTCVNLLVDSSTWLTLPPHAQQEATQAYGASALSLLRSGWRVIGVSYGDKLQAMWPQLARGSQSTAWRATMAETVAGGLH